MELCRHMEYPRNGGARAMGRCKMPGRESTKRSEVRKAMARKALQIKGIDDWKQMVWGESATDNGLRQPRLCRMQGRKKNFIGGVMMSCERCLKTWGATQSKVPFSLGGAKSYAFSRVAREALGPKCEMADLGAKSICVVKTDIEAAKGNKHIQTCGRWAQVVVRD